MTILRFSGGEVVQVSLKLEEVQQLMQDAIAAGVLLELNAPDGRTLIINPQQIQYLQQASDLVETASPNGEARVPA